MNIACARCGRGVFDVFELLAVFEMHGLISPVQPVRGPIAVDAFGNCAPAVVLAATPSSISNREIFSISRTGTLASTITSVPPTARKRESDLSSTPMPTDEMKLTAERSSSIRERPERIASSSAADAVGAHDESRRPSIATNTASGVCVEVIFIWKHHHLRSLRARCQACPSEARFRIASFVRGSPRTRSLAGQQTADCQAIRRAALCP